MPINCPLLCSTFFYVGKFKYAPGTMASLLTLIIWAVIGPEDLLLRSVIMLLLILIGFISTKTSLQFFKEKDPQAIVIDEVIGMSIPLLLITDIVGMLLAFILFRILDILKPSIIYYSQNYKDEYGILLDDIIAGFCVLLLLIRYI